MKNLFDLEYDFIMKSIEQETEILKLLLEVINLDIQWRKKEILEDLFTPLEWHFGLHILEDMMKHI